MRMRAAYDQQQAAISRLRSAAQLASAHGSVAPLRRCEHDLAGHGRRHHPGYVTAAHLDFRRAKPKPHDADNGSRSTPNIMTG